MGRNVNGRYWEDIIWDASSYVRCFFQNKCSIWVDHRFTRACVNRSRTSLDEGNKMNRKEKLDKELAEHHSRFTCNHPVTDIRKRTLSNGSIQYIKQCLRC